MFHAATAPLYHTTTLKNGHLGVVMRRFELEPFLANIEKYKITDAVLVPPLVVAIIMSPITKKYDLRTFRLAWCGTAPLGKGPREVRGVDRRQCTIHASLG